MIRAVNLILIIDYICFNYYTLWGLKCKTFDIFNFVQKFAYINSKIHLCQYPRLM